MDGPIKPPPRKEDWNGGQRDSYPMLHVARRRGMSYTLVFHIAAVVAETYGGKPIEVNGQVPLMVPIEDFQAVYDAWHVERQWQEAASD